MPLAAAMVVLATASVDGGNAEPWTSADQTAARLIRRTVADIVPQFRSVLTLIAQNQLEQVRHQVQLSEQPVVIAGRADAGNARKCPRLGRSDDRTFGASDLDSSRTPDK
jgi:hypothetical protein